MKEFTSSVFSLEICLNLSPFVANDLVLFQRLKFALHMPGFHVVQ